MGWLTSKIKRAREKRRTCTTQQATFRRSKGAKIVVVEDNPVVLHMIKTILQQKKRFLVITATNGKEGIEIIRREKPDLVISDIMMPELDGLSLLDQLRKEATTRSLPVILLTAKDRSEDIRNGYRKGADYYITKPFSKMQLLKGVNLMLAEPADDGPTVWKID